MGKIKSIYILNLEVCVWFQVPLKIIKVLCVPAFLKRLFEALKRLKAAGDLEARSELQTPGTGPSVTGFGAVVAFLFQCLYAEGCVCGIPAGLLAICWPVTSFHSEVCYAHNNVGKSKCRIDDRLRGAHTLFLWNHF